MPRAAKMKKWVFLCCAICSEAIASLCLKASVDDSAWFYLPAGLGYLASFWLLSLTLRAGHPLTVAYSIWSATGVALTAILSAALFGEHITMVMAVGIATIIGGVVLVESGSHTADSATRTEPRDRAR